MPSINNDTAYPVLTVASGDEFVVVRPGGTTPTLINPNGDALIRVTLPIDEDPTVAPMAVSATETGAFTYDADVHLNRIVPFDSNVEAMVTLPGDAEAGHGFTLLQLDGAAQFQVDGTDPPLNFLGHTRSGGPGALVTALFAAGVWVISGSTIA